MATCSISFHCVVCYETFDPDSRYPVVLPCGHTYVCTDCAGRLDKCMECRTSLFYPKEPVSDQKQRNNGREQRNNGRVSSRYSYTRTRSLSYRSGSSSAEEDTLQKVPKKKQNRLPLPKNLVLLSLIEATSRVSSDVKEDGDEEVRIKAGVSITTGESGTYAVASKEGLIVVPCKSIENVHATSSDDKPIQTWKEISAAKNFERANYVMENFSFNTFCERGEKASDSDILEHFSPFKLDYGDRVQIVEWDKNGWAKLSRGRGYIHVKNRSDLVKVAGPRDKACQLEGMIKSLATRWETLKEDRIDLNRNLSVLKNDLQTALLTDDITIVSSPVAVSDDIFFDGREVVNNENICHNQRVRQDNANSSGQLPQRNPSFRAPPNGPNQRTCVRSAASDTVESRRHVVPNFRTGMSGHKALLSSSSKSYDSSDRRDLNLMSCHTGIAGSKRRPKKWSDKATLLKLTPFNSWNTRTEAFPTSIDENRDEESQFSHVAKPLYSASQGMWNRQF